MEEQGEANSAEVHSAPIRRDRLAAKTAFYAGRLVACREALIAQEIVVQATWIHFPLAAGVVGVNAC